MKTTNAILIVVLMLGTLGCDQLSKHVATAKLEGAPRQSYFGDTFRLEYMENRGAFLGLGAEWPDAVRTGLLTVGAAIALVAVLIAAFSFRWSGLPLIGALLVVTAGTSNLVDRVIRGSVVDFMNVGLGSIRTGIFNVADVALMVGVALIMFAGTIKAWFDRRSVG